MSLKYFLKTKYNNVGDALSDIRKEFKALWNSVDGVRTEDVTPASPQSYIPEISGAPTTRNILTVHFETISGKPYVVVDNVYFYINGKFFEFSGHRYRTPYTIPEKENIMDVPYLMLKIELNLQSVIWSNISIEIAMNHPDSTNDIIYYAIGYFDASGFHYLHNGGYPQLLWLSRCADE